MNNTVQRFGSDHTKTKLDAVANYLDRFVTVLKNQNFHTVYFDVCAGSGASSPKDANKNQQSLFDEQILVEGSPLRALDVEPKFDRYIFNDIKLKNVRSLKEIAENRPDVKERIKITQLHASQAISKFCEDTNWKNTRSVVFLDPFGIKPIKFSQIEALGKTLAVDLWYLIPVGAMNRQVTNTGKFLPQSEVQIDEMLGTTNWRENIIVESQQDDLFGDPTKVTTKIGNAKHFENVAIKQLRTVFKGGVSNKALPLGRNGMHEFSLIFACANPSPAASKLALRLANAVLK